MEKAVHKLLAETVNKQIGYTGRKRSTCFQIKDKRKFYHQHYLVYDAKCSSELCEKKYIRGFGRRISERVKERNGRDHKSHILKHSLEIGHEHEKSSDFLINSKNFNGNKTKKFLSCYLSNNYVQQLTSMMNQFR